MGDLAERMHAGIGAAGAARDHVLAGERLDGFGQAPLHRDAVLLHLPADEGRAVIFECELVAGHRLICLKAGTRSQPHCYTIKALSDGVP